MNFFLTQLDKLRHDHPVFFVVVLVPVASIAVNFLIWFFTSKDSRWAKLLAAYPRVAALMKLCEAAGINPVRYLKWLYVLVAGKEWSAPSDSDPPDGPPVGKTYRDVPARVEPTTPPATKRAVLAFAAMLALGALALLAGAALLHGCASGLTPSKVADGLQIAECVLAHDDLPVPQIAAVCAVEDLRQVEDILSAHRAAMARHKAALCAPAKE